MCANEHIRPQHVLLIAAPSPAREDGRLNEESISVRVHARCCMEQSMHRRAGLASSGLASYASCIHARKGLNRMPSPPSRNDHCEREMLIPLLVIIACRSLPPAVDLSTYMYCVVMQLCNRGGK